jgi:hypothetical protein
MPPFTECERDESAESGVFWDAFISAVGIFVYVQDEPPTIEHAALVFNTTPDLVREAAEAHPWLFLEDGCIVSDGA